MAGIHGFKEAAHGEKIMREKVDEYKAAHPEHLPDLDYALFLKMLNQTNESSPVKIARNAFNEKREWIPGTETWNVSGVYLSDDHCVTVKLSHGDKVMTVTQLLDELEAINKKLPMKNVPIMLELNSESRVRATDLYAHSLVSEKWAGLPVDVVLCYIQKREKHAVIAIPSTDESSAAE